MLVKTPLTQCSPSYSAVVVFAIFATPTTYLSGKSANSLLDQGKKTILLSDQLDIFSACGPEHASTKLIVDSGNLRL